MNRPVSRSEVERFNAALAECRRRVAKSEHSTRGYRDEDGVWRGGLLSFVRYFWHILEPGTPFTDGWVLEAICEHLEAVTYGEITNLLINVFPGAMKSLLTNVFWPAWEWGPMELAHIRYVTFSYSSSNTERDNQRFGDLIASPEYQAMYPSVEIRQKGMTMVSNLKHGWKLASSVTGSVTGKRGNRAICFPADQLIATERGAVPIGEFVKNRTQDRVWSYNRNNCLMELKPVSGWHVNPGRRLVKITLEDGHSVTCTEDHPILAYRGYTMASHLRVWDEVFAAPVQSGWQQIKFEMLPSPTVSDVGDVGPANPKFLSKISGCFGMARGYLADHFLRQMRSSVAECPMPLAVSNVLSARSVFEVVPAWIATIPILVADFLTTWARSDKCRRNHRVNRHVKAFAVTPQGDARVSLHDRPRHYFTGDEHFVVGPNDVTRQALNPSKVRDFVEVEPDCWKPYLAHVVDIQLLHEIPSETFCVTVEGNHNMLCGDAANIICSNCDDLNNVKSIESKSVMEETNRWFRESLSSRLNSMETDAKVVISQRVAEGDITGEILSLGLPYCHLCIPMEYVWQADDDGNPYTTSIGWVDPRWKPNPEDCKGELAWPERFSESAVQALKVELGPFATAAQLQQTPEARGGGVIKRDWWLAGEEYMTGNKFPPFDYVVASLDGAFDEKEENDPSALTIWGIFKNEHGYPRAMLVHAWAKRLQISGIKVDMEPGEHEAVYRRRAMPHWGLVEWTADTCNRFKVDRLLIENKASGKPAAQSLQNSHGRMGWAIVLVEPKGDKYARGLAVQPSFSQGMVYFPDRDWAQDVIDECAIFPRGRHDDRYDSTTQAIKHLRDSGLLRSDEDRRAEELDAVRHKAAPKAALYPGFTRRRA